MTEEATLVLRKKTKSHTSVKLANEEYETTQLKETNGSVSLQESVLSRTAEDSHDSDILSRIFENTKYDSDYSTTGTETSQHSIHVTESLYVDLLEVFSGIPDLEEISEDTELRRSIPTTVEAEERPTDVGAFVDPLTGELLGVPGVPISTVVEPEAREIGDDQFDEGEEETESEELHVDMSISEDSEILQLVELEKMQEEVLVEEVRQVDSLEDFLTKQEATIEEEPTLILLKIEELERERLYKIMMTEAENFLRTLIGEVVDIVEYTQPAEILRKNLDKHAVMEEILTKVNELEVERTIRAILNRRVIEYHKRKGLYLAITDDLPDQVMENREKLNYASNQLDRALGLEHAMKMKAEFEQNQLTAEVAKMLENAQTKEEEFRTLVFQSLVKSKGNSEPIISNILNEMFTAYNEVCKTYLELIQIQHTKAELQKKHDNIEYGEGLQRFVLLQTETKELHKKVEDRSVELNFIRARCNRDIHAFSNVKVKGDIVRIVNGMKKKTLACLVADRKKARTKLVHLKEERQRLQKQIRELTFQTGLLSKPVLLKDYDSTVEQTKLVTQNIVELHKQQRELLDKIAKIETKCKPRQLNG